MAAKAAKTLPIEDDISLHKAGWIIQRIGWALMFAFLIAAVLGLFGEGPLSERKIHSGNIEVEYDRFGRYEHGMLVRIESQNETISSISISEEYMEAFRINTIVPTPLKEVAANGTVEFLFEGPTNTVVTFYAMPVQRKTVNGSFRVNNDSFSIKQTIYP
jgi:hypothetical protein